MCLKLATFHAILILQLVTYLIVLSWKNVACVTSLLLRKKRGTNLCPICGKWHNCAVISKAHMKRKKVQNVTWNIHSLCLTKLWLTTPVIIHTHWCVCAEYVGVNGLARGKKQLLQQMVKNSRAPTTPLSSNEMCIVLLANEWRLNSFPWELNEWLDRKWCTCWFPLPPDNRLSAVWEIGGLVGVRCAPLRDAGWAGRWTCAESSCESFITLYSAQMSQMPGLFRATLSNCDCSPAVISKSHRKWLAAKHAVSEQHCTERIEILVCTRCFWRNKNFYAFLCCNYVFFYLVGSIQFDFCGQYLWHIVRIVFAKIVPLGVQQLVTGAVPSMGDLCTILTPRVHNTTSTYCYLNGTCYYSNVPICTLQG